VPEAGAFFNAGGRAAMLVADATSATAGHNRSPAMPLVVTRKITQARK
jgi:hypothetical protein